MTRTAFVAVVAMSVLLSLPCWAGESGTGAEEGDSLFDLSLDARSGLAYIVDRPYWHIAALANLKVWAFQTTLTAPINLDLDGWHIRREDWDEARDFMRILPCARFDWAREYDRESDSFHPYFSPERGDCSAWGLSDEARVVSWRLGPITDLEFGHGHVLTGYNNFLDVDSYTLGLAGQFRARQFVGGDLIWADVTRLDVVGGRIYAHPVMHHGVNGEGEETTHEAELALTVVADLGAPTQAATVFGGARLIDAEGNLIFDRDELVVFGADMHYRMQIAEEWFLAARGDYAFIWDTGTDVADQVGNQGGHLSVGFLWEPPHDPWTLHFYAEYRMVGSSYIPSYFDQYYAVQREQYALSSSLRQNIDPVLTKLGYLRSLGEGGSFLEHSYSALVHFDLWRRLRDTHYLVRFLRLYAFIDHIVGRPNSGSLGFLAVMPNIKERVDLSGAYIRRGFNDAKDMFAIDGTLLRFLARWWIWQRKLYLLGTFDHLWRLNTRTGYYQTTSTLLLTLGWDQDII